MACSSCGKSRGHLDGCPEVSGGGSQPEPKKSRKGKRTQILDNVSKRSAENWASRMGAQAQGGGKKRHYEVVPDENHPGQYKLIFVEDE